MPQTSRDLLTVDLRGIKPALCERARARGVPASTLVREALLRDGLTEAASESSNHREDRAAHRQRTRICLRLAEPDARALAERARNAGRPIGHYVIELMRSSRELPTGADRRALAAALSRSNAELATLSRNIARLTALLAQGAAREAQQYRQNLDALDADVRAHLALASDALSDHAPARL